MPVAVGNNRRPLGLIFHRTRAPLRTRFAVAWQMAQGRRGVLALFLAHEPSLRNKMGWFLTQKLCPTLSERAVLVGDGLVETDESYYGGGGEPGNRDRSPGNPNKSLIAAAIEKVPVSKRHGGGVEISALVAGNASSASLAGLLWRRAVMLPAFVHHQLVRSAKRKGVEPALAR